MSILTTKEGVLASINTGIDPTRSGIILPARTRTAATLDAPRWTVTRMIPASPYWVFSNTGVMMIGWSCYSSMKECAFGLMKNTPS